MANKINFAIWAYFWKYVKKLNIQSFVLWSEFGSSGEWVRVELSPAEMAELLVKAYFEGLSSANMWYKLNVLELDTYSGKKHLRLNIGKMTVSQIAVKKSGGYPETVKAETVKRAAEIVKAEKNQNNKGYIAEVLEAWRNGEDWKPCNKGIDIAETLTEIKFRNGQIEL